MPGRCNNDPDRPQRLETDPAPIEKTAENEYSHVHVLARFYVLLVHIASAGSCHAQSSLHVQ